MGGREMGQVAPPVSVEFWRQNSWHPGLISNRLISRHLKELISNIEILLNTSNSYLHLQIHSICFMKEKSYVNSIVIK
jgi:hypothetical protein